MQSSAAIAILVTNGSNQKIYAQNVANDTQQIGVALNTAYQSVQQAKAAYDEAALNLEVSQRSMNKASVQYQVGSISRLEYLQAESGFVSAQTGLEVKRLALLQAMENYSWIVKGVRS